MCRFLERSPDLPIDDAVDKALRRQKIADDPKIARAVKEKMRLGVAPNTHKLRQG